MTANSEETRGGPGRRVIDEETLGRLMAQVDEEGLELLGPDGVSCELGRGTRGPLAKVQRVVTYLGVSVKTLCAWR